MIQPRFVVYVGENEREHTAVVVADNGPKADLSAYVGGEWSHRDDVPRRAPNSPDGNGVTWHELTER